MVSIVLENAGVAFAIYSGKYQSIRSRILQSATAGRIGHGSHGRVAVNALEPISLRIREGERLGLMGPNGAGKSTFLRVASRVYRPTTGVATITGSVGTLIDMSLGINPEATGRQNIFLRAAMLGISRRKIREKLDEIAEFSELEDFLELPVHTYSSGMQLRLSFAASTILVPDILVMDEWLSVGDQSFRKKAERRLKEVVEGTKILVLASHDRNLLETTCSRGILLDHGKVAFDGPILEATNLYFGPKI